MEGAKSLLARPGTDHVATRLACEDIPAPPPPPELASSCAIIGTGYLVVV